MAWNVAAFPCCEDCCLVWGDCMIIDISGDDDVAARVEIKLLQATV